MSSLNRGSVDATEIAVATTLAIFSLAEIFFVLYLT